MRMVPPRDASRPAVAMRSGYVRSLSFCMRSLPRVGERFGVPDRRLLVNEMHEVDAK
jgi:hypothetical protein